MSNTNCQVCIFADTVDSAEPCKFHLIENINRFKQIERKNNYNYIYDYQCLYGFSKERYINTAELHDTDLVELVRNNATILYYLVVDLRQIENEADILAQISEIKNLDIPPQFVSFIITADKSAQEKVKLFDNNITSIKWKAHAFLVGLSFNECCNIASETTTQSSNAQFIMFHDPLSTSDKSLNEKTLAAHFIFKITQQNVHCLQESKSKLSGTFMPISIYRSMLNGGDRNLLYVLSEIKDFIIKDYEIEKTQ